MLRSDLCDYSDAYIVVKGRVNVKATPNTDADQKDAAFKNESSFRSFITKINSTLIDNAEDLHTVMPTSGGLWNYYREEIDDADDNASESKSFKYKTKLIGKTEARPQRSAQECPDVQENQPPPPPNQPTILSLNTKVVVSLKYLSNFLGSLDLVLITVK